MVTIIFFYKQAKILLFSDCFQNTVLFFFLFPCLLWLFVGAFKNVSPPERLSLFLPSALFIINLGLILDVTSHKSDTNEVLYDFGVLALGSNLNNYPVYYV